MIDELKQAIEYIEVGKLDQAKRVMSELVTFGDTAGEFLAGLLSIGLGSAKAEQLIQEKPNPALTAVDLVRSALVHLDSHPAARTEAIDSLQCAIGVLETPATLGNIAEV